MTSPPSYDSIGLVNLMAEIETRMTGSAIAPRLDGALADLIPDSDTLVLVLFDGLGTAQLQHERAASFRNATVGVLHAGFPTTTSASLATIATALPPSQHGVVAHLTWLPDHQRVVNTLKWVDLGGNPVPHDYAGLLPRPNLWERLKTAGVEPITVQPGDFRTSPLTRALYRGARFEGIWDVDDLVEATVSLASEPRRFIFTYVPQVDVAGHVFGLGSEEFSEAISIAARVWDGLINRLPPGAALIGTADHGLVEYDEGQKLLIRHPRFDGVRLAGDPRGIQVWGDPTVADDLARLTDGVVVDPRGLIGPAASAAATERIGDHLVLAAQDTVILPRGFDKRLHSYHGGLDPREVEVPLLIG
jgi:hypothetical protein